ncbi:hypothetical protein HP436_13650 [Pseudomonas sp. CrR14]|nr:hypothetical protein [Pseudomonas sp. CrR14]
MFERVGVKLLVLLVFLSSATVFFIVFLMKLIAALYVFTVAGGGGLWVENLIVSARGGLGAGVVIGIGMWIISRVEEKRKRADKES